MHPFTQELRNNKLLYGFLFKQDHIGWMVYVPVLVTAAALRNVFFFLFLYLNCDALLPILHKETIISLILVTRPN